MLLAVLRVSYRAPMAVAWTLAVHWWLTLRRVFLKEKWGSRRATDKIGLWGAGLGWIMGLRVKHLNERSGPLADVVLANHMGFLDVPALLTVFPAVFIIKAEALRAPYFGKALKSQGHVFVNRRDRRSAKKAAEDASEVMQNGDRLIVFPEGKASPGLERPKFKSFCFKEAAKLGKSIEFCVIDYLPDRKMLEWDVTKPQMPQFIELLGRHRTHVSLEFFPAEVPEDGEEAATRYRELTKQRLAAYDEARGS